MVDTASRSVASLAVLMAASAASLVLVPAIALRYSYSTLTAVESLVGFLTLLATASVLWTIGARALRRPDAASRVRAIRVGLVLGLLWLAEISINNFLAPPLPARDIVDDVFWAAISIAILVLAARAAHRTGRLKAGVEAGVWSGLASGLVACLTALSMVVFGMSFVTADPLNVAEWAAREASAKAPSMEAYFAFETFAGGLMHLVLLGLIMGVVLGAVGGALGKGAWLAGRRRPAEDDDQAQAPRGSRT